MRCAKNRAVLDMSGTNRRVFQLRILKYCVCIVQIVPIQRGFFFFQLTFYPLYQIRVSAAQKIGFVKTCVVIYYIRNE